MLLKDVYTLSLTLQNVKNAQETLIALNMQLITTWMQFAKLLIVMLTDNVLLKILLILNVFLMIFVKKLVKLATNAKLMDVLMMITKKFNANMLPTIVTMELIVPKILVILLPVCALTFLYQDAFFARLHLTAFNGELTKILLQTANNHSVILNKELVLLSILLM